MRRGSTWSASVDVGQAFGIQNAQFPAVVAGDDSRASYAFLGTPTGGDDQHARQEAGTGLLSAFDTIAPPF